jgi:hypothetical protein
MVPGSGGETVAEVTGLLRVKSTGEFRDPDVYWPSK